MNKSLATFLKIFIPLAIGIFLIWYIYTSLTPEQLNEVKTHFKNANYAFVLLSVALSVISHVFRAYRWNFMLEPLGHKAKLANSFMAVSVAYLMNVLIPKSGEVSRAIVIDKYEKIPFEKGFGTIISERVVDLLFLLAFTITALLLRFDELYNYLKDIIPQKTIYIILAAIVLMPVGFFLFLKFSKSNINKKIKDFIFGLKDGVLSILTMKKKGAFILHSFIIWGLYILSFYTASLALEETSLITFGTILITFVVGSFTFAFTNSGLGTYPAAIMGILLVFGITKDVGTAFGWIVWTSNIASIILFGVLSFIFLPIYNKGRV
ncbi:lysylphosphatidylglycerol synthase transmembrane domain-containing protein [Patiriisocius hiemis]|uniref:Lysylphosphatidylglycerol synthase transmembrane domain-containing protein n=1 Tax=Patiriisocius hiemis TaxID=3075604 RepID=A0ABU2YFM1_9FLAO|nr:lysylphosphatidylglycerol synthase transmembrane domain-containing protein [Constantimarinum sp. W242]MDT0556469.1 lysylphosphatidylglycerol synthase transmembrane domain-containing protein [Constantimarinum sp. W242]